VSRAQVRVQQCPRGPVLVRGAEIFVDEDGVEHPVTRPVVALCVCERSARKPWCDGTHKALRDDPR
jgi:CDGSH-type Zn-finger protein